MKGEMNGLIEYLGNSLNVGFRAGYLSVRMTGNASDKR